MYDLGIIGGMGPLSSAEIYRRIIEKTKASHDQEHMSIVILNNPGIPDRTNAILHLGVSPTPYLNECIKELVSLHTVNFIIACNTAHFFAKELVIDSSINFINMIDECLKVVEEKYHDLPVVILSTIGTIISNIYKTNQYASNLNIIYPDEYDQTRIMNYIYDMKAGLVRTDEYGELKDILIHLKKIHENCVFIFACTELSLVSKYLHQEFLIVDAVDEVVNAVILKCGYARK